jgi:acyl-coenzyme A synthetase/AMP-(fatty) acid ligase
VGETTLGAEAILAALRPLLPRYMLPRRLIVEEQLPKNANGKCDRKALLDRLQAVEG